MAVLNREGATLPVPTEGDGFIPTVMNLKAAVGKTWWFGVNNQSRAGASVLQCPAAHTTTFLFSELRKLLNHTCSCRRGGKGTKGG